MISKMISKKEFNNIVMEIQFIEVPAGDFIMGNGDEVDEEYHNVYLDTFYISQAPITNAQYQLFVEATKHRTPDHFKNGQAPHGLENHPVVNVDCIDAMKYCEWLSRVIGKEIMLPSEAEWEKAARGSEDKRKYPWGDEWDETKCNCHELGLGGTTPIGSFPKGASPYGCLDMVGNVWEWTRSVFKKYPYDSADGREDLDASGPRVLRGGSFRRNVRLACCAARAHYGPDGLHNRWGFRVVLANSCGRM